MMFLRCRIRRLALLGIAAVCVLPTGCGKSPSKSSVPKTGNEQPAAKTPPVNVAKKSEPAAKKDPAGPTADAALRTFFTGLREGKPKAAWDFLPPSYRRDVNDVVHEFAGSMDAELWNKTFAFAARTLKLLKARKQEILKSPAWKQIPDLDDKQLAEDFDGLLALAEIIVTSDLADLEKLKTIDVGRFLDTTGAGVVSRLPGFSQMLPPGASVKLVAGNDSEAELQIIVGDNVQTVEFVRVEGRWIHKSLASRWAGQIAKLRADLKVKLDPKKLADRKQVVLARLSALEKTLAELESAKTDAEFQQRLTSSPFLVFLVAMFRDPGSLPSVVGTVFPDSARNAAQGGKKLTVLVVVDGDLDPKTRSQVGDELFKLGAYDLGDIVADGKTTVFPISEVGNFDTLRKQIRFAEVISADAKKLEIRIRLKQAKAKKE